MLSTLMKWFGYTKDGSIVINSPSSSATVSGVVTFQGTSIQTVNGVPLPAQSWSISADLSAVSGAYTFTATNSAGHIDDRTVIVNNVSPNDTIIWNNEGNLITDSSGAKWSVTAGKVFRNSATVGVTNGVRELIWHNGTFIQYYPGPPSSCWAWDGANWNQTAWPVPVHTLSEFGHMQFWGINGHQNNGGVWSAQQQQVTCLVASGLNVYRTNTSHGDTTSLKQFISAYAAPSHVAVYPCFLPNVGADESSSYANGYSLGAEMATALQGYVPCYELCNELDGYAILGGGNNGDVPSHYSNTRFLQCRGLLRGMIDGIRSVDATTPIIGPAAGWLHYGFTDMLWNGNTPASSGSTDASKVVRWDVTTWHWYDNMGDIENAGNISANVLQHIANTYGKPIRINEYGCYGSDFTASGESALASYLTGSNLMGKWDSKRATYNIVGCDYYELYDDTSQGGDEATFGIYLSDTTTKKSIRWSAMNAYVIAHP